MKIRMTQLSCSNLVNLGKSRKRNSKRVMKVRKKRNQSNERKSQRNRKKNQLRNFWLISTLNHRMMDFMILLMLDKMMDSLISLQLQNLLIFNLLLPQRHNLSKIYFILLLNNIRLLLLQLQLLLFLLNFLNSHLTLLSKVLLHFRQLMHNHH